MTDNNTIAEYKHKYCLFLLDKGDSLTEALKHITDCINVSKKNNKNKYNKNYLDYLSCLGSIYLKIGKQRKAMSVLKQCLHISRRIFPLDYPLICAILHDIADIVASSGEYSEAVRIYDRALAVQRSQPDHDQRDLAVTLNNMAVAYQRQGRYNEATALYKESLSIKRNCYPPNHRSIGIALYNAASVDEATGQLDSAMSNYISSLLICRRYRLTDSIMLAEVLSCMARIRYKQGNVGAAIGLLLDSFQILQKSSLSPYHTSTVNTIINLASIYSKVERNLISNIENEPVKLGAFLIVNVCMGDLLAKKVGEKNSHQSYQVIIRSLTREELEYEMSSRSHWSTGNKPPALGSVYLQDPGCSKLIASGGYELRSSHVFADYLALHQAMEDEGVYSLDQVVGAVDALTNAMATQDTSINIRLVGSEFPRIYKRRYLGIKLKEHQLQRRMLYLNNWIGSLLQLYPKLSGSCRRLILSFLSSGMAHSNTSSSVSKSYDDNSSTGTGRKTSITFLGKTPPTRSIPLQADPVNEKKTTTPNTIFTKRSSKAELEQEPNLATIVQDKLDEILLKSFELECARELKEWEEQEKIESDELQL